MTSTEDIEANAASASIPAQTSQPQIIHHHHHHHYHAPLPSVPSTAPLLPPSPPSYPPPEYGTVVPTQVTKTVLGRGVARISGNASGSGNRASARNTQTRSRQGRRPHDEMEDFCMWAVGLFIVAMLFGAFAYLAIG